MPSGIEADSEADSWELQGQREQDEQTLADKQLQVISEGRDSKSLQVDDIPLLAASSASL